MSAAQKAIQDLANVTHLTSEERKVAAMNIWNHEKGLAAAVIILAWLFKVRAKFVCYEASLINPTALSRPLDLFIRCPSP